MEVVFRGDAMLLARRRRGYWCAYVVMRWWDPTEGPGAWIPMMNCHGETKLHDSKKAAQAQIVREKANGENAKMRVAKLLEQK